MPASRFYEVFHVKGESSSRMQKFMGAAPSFGLAEINYTVNCNFTAMGRVKCVTGQANLKGYNKFYQQVKGQFIISGLSCFITNNVDSITVERVCRDDGIKQR